jgi:hypothetical protein
MTQGLESWAADEFIYAKLKNDATLTALIQAVYAKYGQEVPADPEVYSDTVPSTITFPYVIFQLRTPFPDTTVVEGIRIFTRLDYLVKVVDRAQSYADIAPIYSQVDKLLHLATGTVADGVVYFTQRMQLFRFPEIDDAIQYRHLGGIYRLTVQS